MNYKNVQKTIRDILFEWNPRVTDDHSAGKLAKAQKGSEHDLPLAADSRSSIDSIVSRPPVEDSGYVPTTATDLGAAIRALSELLTGEQISHAYGEIRKIIDNAGSAQPTPDSMKESVYDDYDSFELPDDSDMPEEFRSGYSIEEPDEEPEEPSGFTSSKSSGEASLEDLLSLGILPDEKKSISSVKQYIGKGQANLAIRMAFGSAEVEKAMEYALKIWVGALKADGGITEEQAAGFLQNPKGAIQSPGLKAFFQLGFAGPAMKPILNARNKQIKKEVADLGTPDQLKNMLFSQTVGLSPINGKKIRMKLSNIYKDASMTEIDEMVKKFAGYVKSNAIKYQKDYFKEIDLTKEVKDAWSKLSTDKKIDITYAAMDEVIDTEDKFRKAGIR